MIFRSLPQEEKMLLHPAFPRIYTGVQSTIGVETGKEIMIKRSVNHQKSLLVSTMKMHLVKNTHRSYSI